LIIKGKDKKSTILHKRWRID